MMLVSGLVLLACTSMESGFTFGVFRGSIEVEVAEVNKFDLDCHAEKNERGDYVLTAFNRETGEVLKVEKNAR